MIARLRLCEYRFKFTPGYGVWCYLTLDQLLYLRVALVELLEEFPFTKAGISQSSAHLMLRSQQGEVTRDMADVLQIVEVAITELSAEKYPTVSLALWWSEESAC